MHEGNWDQALQEVTNLEINKGLTYDEHLACHLLKSQILTQRGFLESGLQLVNQVLDQRQTIQHQLLFLNAIITKGELWRQSRKKDPFNVAYRHDYDSRNYLQLIEEGEQLLATFTTLPSQERTDKEARLKLFKGRIYVMEEKLDRSLEELQQSLTLFKDLGDSEGIAESLGIIGAIYLDKNDLDRYFEYIHKSLAIYEESGDQEAIAYTYLWRLNQAYSVGKGRVDLALENLHKAMDIFQDLGNKKGIGQTFGLLADLYVRYGDLKRGMDCLQKGKAIFQEIGDKAYVGWFIFAEGWAYRQKGDIDTAFERLEKSLAIFEEAQHHEWMLWALFNLGIVHHYKGNLDEASKYYKRCLKLSKQIRQTYGMVIALWRLGLLAIDTNSEEQLNNCLHQLDEQYTKFKFLYISQYVNHIKAMSLKKSKRLTDQMDAQKLLQQLADQPVIDREVTADAMLHLCDLLTFELKTTGNEDLLQEIKKIIAQILELADSQHSFILHIEALLLQAKLAVIEGTLQTATELMTQAETLAIKQDLPFLIDKVRTEKHQLGEEFEKWEQLIKRNASFRERLESARMDEYIKEVQKRVRLMG